MDRERVEAEIQEIFDRNGEVRTGTVLEAARDRNSALHECFEWSNAKAAHEYRLIQARTLIRSVHVVVDGRRERLVHVPLVVIEDDDSREGYYKPVSVVVRVEDEFSRALREAMTRLASAKSAVDELVTVRNPLGDDFNDAAGRSLKDVQRAINRLEAFRS